MVPVDESKPSENSLAVAAGLARETGAQVILTHVVQLRWSQDEPEMRATYGEIVDDYRTSGEETLRRTASSETFSGLDVDTQLLFGNNPASELLRLAKEREVDAIVMGSHGRGRFRGMVLGSVSQRVIHDATVPVIIVPPHLERAEEASG
jgi:nucleotide-binding universal stress UspA family protein